MYRVHLMYPRVNARALASALISVPRCRCHSRHDYPFRPRNGSRDKEKAWDWIPWARTIVAAATGLDSGGPSSLPVKLQRDMVILEATARDPHYTHISSKICTHSASA